MSTAEADHFENFEEFAFTPFLISPFSQLEGMIPNTNTALGKYLILPKASSNMIVVQERYITFPKVSDSILYPDLLKSPYLEDAHAHEIPNAHRYEFYKIQTLSPSATHSDILNISIIKNSSFTDY